MNNDSNIPDRIPANLTDNFQDRVGKAFADHISHENFHNKIKDIINEAVDTVPFMKKIKEYASEEIDTRIYKSQGFLVRTVAVPIVVAILTVVALKLLNLTK